MREPVILTLPEPPSANRWWRIAGNALHLSHAATDYKADVARRAGVTGAPLFPTEPLSVVIVWHRDRLAGDLDKRVGILLDAMQSIKKRVPDPKAVGRRKTRDVMLAPGVYDDDNQVVQIWARRCDAHPTIPKGFVQVEICPIATAGVP